MDRRSTARPIIDASRSPTTPPPEPHEGDALTKVISIANQKGGVGKTTCSINLGGALAERGYRVLCVDMDPQANLTVGLGISLSDVRQSMADVLSDDRVSARRDRARRRRPRACGSRPRRSSSHRPRSSCSPPSAARWSCATRSRGWADRQFDVVIIDCPPTLGLLTINSLVASNRVIIPVQTQYYAIKGLTALIKVINTIKIKLNHDLEVLGLLPTFYDGRTVLAREMLENLKQLGDHRVFNTMIKNTVKLGEAPLTGQPGHRVRDELVRGARVPRPGPGGDRAWLRSVPRSSENIHRLFDEAQATDLAPGHRVAHRVTRHARADPRGPGRQDPPEPGAAAPLLRRGVAHRAGRLDPRARRPPADPRPTQRTEVRAHRRRAPLARVGHGRPRDASRPSSSSSTSSTALEVSIIENLQREDVSPLEEAAMFRKMTETFGYSVRQLAQKVGKDKGYVENRLRLTDAPADIRELVSLRKDTISHAYELMKIGDERKRRRLAKRIAAGELSLAKLRLITGDRQRVGR